MPDPRADPQSVKGVVDLKLDAARRAAVRPVSRNFGRNSYWRCDARRRSVVFVEAAADQALDGVDHLRGLLAAGFHGDGGAGAGCQHHQAHD